ncbi:MAG: ATP-binding protein [Betaproteobacteria bacterium]|nr:ATP-binding protein [Betaproteobacteria bacterium]
MSFSVVQSRAIAALTPLPVSVETDLSNGLPQFSIVGLPDTAVREAKERVRSAILNSGFEFPSRRITVNLAPADLPKDSGRFDLAIAIGILIASDQIRSADLLRLLSKLIFVGELSLTGSLLPIRGAFAMAAGFLHEQSIERSLILPLANQKEVSVIGSNRLRFASSLRETAGCLATGAQLTGCDQAPLPPKAMMPTTDWSEIRGQSAAKRAAIIAAAGQHNLLMLGPPGVGKSMIAARVAALLPSLSHTQACELAAIQSLIGAIDLDGWRRPPYRSPHHSASSRALIGGGQPVRPGEISLAHHGVLFLDELPEFPRDALESLREPLERHEVEIARVRDRVSFPASFMLIAAMNPCPCGYFGVRNAKKLCRCSPDRILRYRSRLSGPLMDRFDMAVAMESPTSQQLAELDTSIPSELNSHVLMDQVSQVRSLQLARQSCLNSHLGVRELQIHADCDSQAKQLLMQAAGRWGWSARSWHRLIRVARTIADVDGEDQIRVPQIAEAIELRRAIDAAAEVQDFEQARSAPPPA